MSDDKTAPRQAAELVTVEPGHEGQRIDNFLMTYLKGVPKSWVYRVLRTGEVRVNKGRAKPTYRVIAGDLIRIPPVRRSEAEEPLRPGTQVLEAIEKSVLYEDAGLLILNKPSGIAVHGGSGLSYGVIEALRVLRPGASLELVHRLDRETSGCLMIAKKRSTLRALHELLREGGMDKRYLALVQGRWRGGERRVSVSLQKNVLSSGERMVTVREEGKAAESIFRPVTRFEEATLVEVQPLTGRTHQIRVHAAHLGHPIAGDEKYGDRDFNRAMRESGLRRLFLHARSLRFRIPSQDKPVEVTAPVDKALENVLSSLKKII